MSSAQGAEPVLRVRDLTVEFTTADGVVHAVTDVSYDVAAGETLAVVGESGCGKTVSALALLGLLPQPQGRVVGGSATLHGRDLLSMDERELQAVRGGQIGMVFQDPMTSLNPVLTAGAQIAEALHAHAPGMRKTDHGQRVVKLLALVGIPDPVRHAAAYPHQLSGGMRQRVMIAMAMANRPSVLIADEPTTALDVTVQAQVLDVLRTAQRETGAATILITHDLSVVAEMADRVAVMYAGRIVELGGVQTVFDHPRHPYTAALLSSLPDITDRARLAPIGGQPPSLLQPPPGCAFHPRCPVSGGRLPCRTDVPPRYPTNVVGQSAACHYWDEVGPRRGTAAS